MKVKEQIAVLASIKERTEEQNVELAALLACFPETLEASRKLKKDADHIKKIVAFGYSEYSDELDKHIVSLSAAASLEKRKLREKQIKKLQDENSKLTTASVAYITGKLPIMVSINGVSQVNPDYADIANRIVAIAEEIETLQTEARQGYEFEELSLDSLFVPASVINGEAVPATSSLDVGDFLKIIQKTDGTIVASRIVVPEDREASFVLRKKGTTKVTSAVESAEETAEVESAAAVNE